MECTAAVELRKKAAVLEVLSDSLDTVWSKNAQCNTSFGFEGGILALIVVEVRVEFERFFSSM